MRKIMASLDIGSDKIKLVVGEIFKHKLNVLAVTETPSKGIKKGIIVNSENVLEGVKEVYKKAEEIIGLKIRQTVVAIPSNFAEYSVVEGEIDIESEDKVVRGNDIVRVLQKAIKGQISPNMELVAIMPSIFKIDDEKSVKNPKKMIASKLAVKAVLAVSPKKIVYPILECLEKNGIEVLDIGFTSLGDYFEFVTPEMNESVGAIVNIGDSTTTISIFNKGTLTNSTVFDLGSQNIDNDISFIYKLTKTDSKYLKENMALAHKRLAQASIKEKYTNKLGEEITINQYELSEIVMSRITEILNMAKKQINHLTKKQISYIIFTGGLTEIVDFPLVLEEIYGTSAKVGSVNEIGARSNKYSSSLGLIKYYNHKAMLRDRDFSIFDINEQEELGGLNNSTNITEGTILGKLFGYFFDN